MNVCVGTYAWVNMCVYGYLCMHVYYMDVCVGTYILINMCVYGYLCWYVRVFTAICIVFSIFYHVYIKHFRLISRYSCLFHKHFS